MRYLNFIIAALGLFFTSRAYAFIPFTEKDLLIYVLVIMGILVVPIFITLRIVKRKWRMFFGILFAVTMVFTVGDWVGYGNAGYLCALLTPYLILLGVFLRKQFAKQ